jgi:hypothetical protein
MYPHRIRLRGPWDCEPLARMQSPAHEHQEPLPPKGRMMLPCRWREGGLGDFAGKVQFVRHFGWPSSLDPHERLWLTFAAIEGTAEIWLKDHFLGRKEIAAISLAFEVTPLIQPRNCLAVTVDAPGGTGGLWGEVALEVRCAAYLKNVRAWSQCEGTSCRVHIAGEAQGVSARPLDLYIVLERSTILYAALVPAPAGQPFHFASEPVSLQEALEDKNKVCNICIELVDGPSVWHHLEGLFAFGGEPIVFA